MLRFGRLLCPDRIDLCPDARQLYLSLGQHENALRQAQGGQRDHDTTDLLFFLADGPAVDITDQLVRLAGGAAAGRFGATQLRMVFVPARPYG